MDGKQLRHGQEIFDKGVNGKRKPFTNEAGTTRFPHTKERS
jgi:hypothetical protein